ncbi:hypothetical protein C8Q77DRAFT_116682 [Trametes polyzona]|nr:hypothetical protein C8Q77DRAFT_116682 [Trametes polyzona]
MSRGPFWLDTFIPAPGFTLFSLCLLPLVSSKLVNRTIDDEKGDSVTGAQPTYAPDNLNWIQGTTCVHCSFLPGTVIDVDANFDGTWHDCTYHPGTPDRTITASFSGVAIYALFTVPNFLQFTTTFMNLSFYVDDAYLGQFEHTPDASSTINYQVLCFHTTNLANKDHTIEIRATGPTDSVILFDYMIYTVDDGTEISSNPVSPVPPITTTPPAIITTAAPPSSSFISTPLVPPAVSKPSSSENPDISSRSSSTTTSPSSSSRISTSIPTVTPTYISANGTTTSAPVLDGKGSSNPTASPPSTSPPAAQASAGPSTGEASPPIGSIAGGIAGGLALLLFILASVWYVRRRRRRASTPSRLVRPEARRAATVSRAASGKEDPAHAATAVPAQPILATRRPRPVTLLSDDVVPVSGRSDAESVHDSAFPRSLPTSPTERTRSLRSAAPSTYAATSRTGESSQLRAQVATLQEELARLRDAEGEMHRLFIEPPPVYEP